MATTAAVDPDFLALPLDRLADAALAVARARGATYADFRIERLRSQTIVARDRELETSVEGESVGFSVRVVCKGAWGFAAGIDLTADAVASVAHRAVDVAESLAPLNTEPVTLADEPVYTDTYVSSYEIDPFAVAEDEKIDFLLALNERALASKLIDRVTSHVDARARAEVLRLAGRIAHHAAARAREGRSHRRPHRQGDGRLRNHGQRLRRRPGGGGNTSRTVYDFGKDADEIPALLEQKMESPSIKPGRYDLVIDPTNLWLTIHESIGHSTELDRVLGYEANYAGTSFATLDKLNTLQFGAPMMHVTGDRQVEHGLSTVGYDDEGVAAQTWDIIRDGVLVGYQLDRQMAHKQGFGRSNGCAFADQAGRVPLAAHAERLAERRARSDITLDDLLAGMDEGLYIVGDKSWSIDMQRYNFQFTGPEVLPGARRQDRRPGEGRRLSVEDDRFLERDGSGRRAVDLRARRCVQLRQGTARADCAGHARMPGGAVPADQHPEHRAGGPLITLQDTIERVLRLSKADACIVIARRVAGVNIRWANNTVTTNGDADDVQLSVVSIVGRRVASVTRTHFPPERLEEIVRESEEACARRPEAPDYMPLLDGDGEPADWGAPSGRRGHPRVRSVRAAARRTLRAGAPGAASRRSATPSSRRRRRCWRPRPACGGATRSESGRSRSPPRRRTSSVRRGSAR